jgi:hypothetical protein
LNSIDGRLVVFLASPTQQLLPHWSDCTFQSQHHPYFLDHVGSWKALPDDESICAIIQDEPLKPKETISMENNKIPEGLTPLEGSCFLNVGGNKEKEEELQLKVVVAISMKIRTPRSSSNIEINV